MKLRARRDNGGGGGVGGSGGGGGLKKQQRNTSSSDFIPEFCEFFLPHQSAYKLRIPWAFVHQVNGKIPKKCILKIPGVRSWNVKVIETADGTFITEGWEDFVKTQALCTGELLVFSYDESATFTIKIFDTDGCERRFSASGNIAAPIKIEDETDDETETQQAFRDPSHKASPNYTEQSQERTDNTSDLETMAASKIVKSGSYKKYTGLSESGVPYLITPCVIESRMIIPKEIVTKFHVKLKPKMFLCYDDQRWPVVVRKESDGRLVFGSGWRQFSKENKLDMGKFLFRFGTTRAVEEIEVQVLPDSGETPCGIKDDAVIDL